MNIMLYLNCLLGQGGFPCSRLHSRAPTTLGRFSSVLPNYCLVGYCISPLLRASPDHRFPVVSLFLLLLCSGPCSRRSVLFWACLLTPHSAVRSPQSSLINLIILIILIIAAVAIVYCMVHTSDIDIDIDIEYPCEP